MKFLRLAGEPHTSAITLDEVEAAPSPWPRPPSDGEVAGLGARLSQLLAQESPDDLLGRLAEFKRSVEDALLRSSSAYHILRQLEESGLKDCARCTSELEARLAGNPHYLVLAKITEAQKIVSELTASQL